MASLPQQLPIPSPFSLSVESHQWSSRPPIQLWTLFLRFVALLLSFAATLSLTTTPKGGGRTGVSNFDRYPHLMYCFVVGIVTFVYSAFQLFKGVCDISYRGIMISDKISDYLSFILDQVVAYLLISSASVGIQGIQQTRSGTALWKTAIISVASSFAMFSVVATCAVLSGYKLCRRIIW